MSNSTILKAIPIVLLLALCLILAGITLAKNAQTPYLPTMADGAETNEGTSSAEVTSAPEEAPETEPQETLPPETEPPETEPIVIASEGLEFTSLGNGTCYVSGAGSCRDSFIILPEASAYGEKVIGIGDYAFRNCKFVKCVELNDNVKFVGAYAFYGTEIVNVYIPAELEQVGDFAFCSCPELEGITVDPANGFYSDVDGVLLNKAMDTVICYPQGKIQSELFLSSEITEIKTMAFYKCDRLKLINYNGSVSSFRRIKVGAGNEFFENAIVTYVSGNNPSYNQEK